MNMPSAMRIIGRAHWYYQRHLKARLPARWRQALSHAARSKVMHMAAHLDANYNAWRVKRAPTKVMGPQYHRSRSFIEIDITWACNLNCFNCNRSCEQAATGEHMTVEQIQRFVDESVAANSRWGRIRLLGGEPTVHKQFFEILDVVRAYRDQHSPDTVIEVITNGHGDKVNAAIARIPADVAINNTSKETKVQPHFGSFNIAPKDVPSYADADYRNGCWVIENCGFGLGPNGYYPCAVAGGIDRIYGWDLGRKSLPVVTDGMDDLLEKFCQHCGHFKREIEGSFDAPIMSETWKAAYEKYKKKRPQLTRYGGGDAPAEVLEPTSDHPRLKVLDNASRPEGPGRY
jgi:hypothetical protein